MKILGRRVDRLEQAAREIRLRSFAVEVAEERGLDPERVLELYAECRARTAALRARGMTPDESIEATAGQMGVPVQRLRAECQELVERFALRRTAPAGREGRP